MTFVRFLEVYVQAGPGVASPVCVVTGHGAKQSMAAEAITVSPKANTSASCHTDWILNMGPAMEAIEAIISNDIYWRLYGVSIRDMQKGTLTKTCSISVLVQDDIYLLWLPQNPLCPSLPFPSLTPSPTPK